MATLEEIQSRFYSFRVEADTESGGWFIWFPDLPGCMTQAETWDEISTMARDAFMSWTEATFEHGVYIAPPREHTTDLDTWRWPNPIKLSATLPTLTSAEAAKRLGVSVRRVSALANQRGLGEMFGNVRLFSEADIESLSLRKSGRPRKEAALAHD